MKNGEIDYFQCRIKKEDSFIIQYEQSSNDADEPYLSSKLSYFTAK